MLFKVAMYGFIAYPCHHRVSRVPHWIFTSLKSLVNLSMNYKTSTNKISGGSVAAFLAP